MHQKKDALFIEFDLPKKAITPGQFAAWYLEDELIEVESLPINMKTVRIAIAYLLFLVLQGSECGFLQYFSNAKENVQQLQNPHEFLSERALIRREKQNIGVKQSDLPLSKERLHA